MLRLKLHATIILVGLLFSSVPLGFISINAESNEFLASTSTDKLYENTQEELIYNMFAIPRDKGDYVKTNWKGGDFVSSMRVQSLLYFENQKKTIVVTEYSQLDAAIKTALENNIQYLAYNNEGMNGDLSAPPEEVKQASHFIELVADKTHAAGLDFISVPSFRIMIDIVNDVNWRNVNAEIIAFQLQRAKSTQQFIDEFNEKAGIIRPQAPNSIFMVQINPEWQSIDDVRLILKGTNGDIGGISIACNTDACTEDYLDQLLGMRTQSPSEPKIPSWVRDIFVWYAEGKIPEDQLLNALRYLVTQKIIILD